MSLIFPESFSKGYHSDIPGCKTWKLADSNGDIIISVVGGSTYVHGDGVKTFEMYDFREDDIQGYLSADEINKHLTENPIE